jgi:hypothetical protein
MDHRQNVRAKAINLLERNLGVILCDFGLGSVFLGKMPIA